MGGDPGVASCGVTSTGCAVSGIARVGGDPAAGPSESAFAVGAISGGAFNPAVAAGTGSGAWLAPQALLTPRFLKISAQIDF